MFSEEKAKKRITMDEQDTPKKEAPTEAENRDIKPKQESPPGSEEEQEKQEEEVQEEHGVTPTVIEEEMKESYLSYAMSVIVGRALPDVRDGLKPVHRRILYAMSEIGLTHNKPFKKSARIVGEVLGKYHPHGDTAVYDSLVRMAQDFSLRYPLVKGQGNFGSIDGDSAAAMRYTEARLEKLSEEMLEDIDKDTVNFVPNFDESLKEPKVLPAKAPQLLINGSSGIAVGMATNIPPHNMKEIAEGVIKTIDNPEITALELNNTITGPDFPTGGQILGTAGIKKAYVTGHGKIKVRAVYDIEKVKDRERIIITEIPYMVNKASMIEQIAELVKDKKILGISDIRDESDKDGIRVVIECKRDAHSDIVINQLLKHSKLQVTFGIIMLALVNNEPKVLNIKQILSEFIKHRVEVITRRTAFDLKKAKERAHILEGLSKALEKIDEIIRLIKSSKEVATARQGLMQNFSLSEKQANAILEMKLQRLTALEQEKIKKEYEELLKKIDELNAILSDINRIHAIIKDDMAYLISQYKEERRTEILTDIEDEDIDMEDLIQREYQVVTITRLGYVKRQGLASYRQQNRGGRGIIGTETRDGDVVERIFVANTHDTILCFTESGHVHWLKVYQLPEGSRTSKGRPIINLIDNAKQEKITSMLPVRKFDENKFVLFATKKGIIKKTSLNAYAHPRRGGIKAIILDEDDRLIATRITSGNDDIILATEKGQSIRFNEKDARPMGRTARGVIGMRLKKDDKVIGMVLSEKDKTILTITENGFGKRTPISQYSRINRGGLGVINIKVGERNGKVVAIRCIDEEDEMMFISRNGIIIRIPAKTISVIGRNTLGVRIMRLKDDDKVVAAAKVIHEEDVEQEEEIAKEENSSIHETEHHEDLSAEEKSDVFPEENKSG